jgi:hypothetical protein
VAGANRHLLEVYLRGALIPRKDFISSYVVWENDQAERRSWFLTSTIIFVLLCLVVDLNATSWHGFYSNQIATMWMQPVPGLERRVPLARLDTTLRGGPYHLISGTVQMMGHRDRSDESLPRDHFLFSKRFFGSTRTGFASPAEYDSGTLTLANAVAVSGAAISPTQSNSNVLVAVLLFLANIRLGQWIINPGRQSWLMGQWARMFENWPVTPIRFLTGLFQKADHRAYCFVTDGGHSENLGIEPLLRRRCRLIIAADASQDGDYSFADFDSLVRWARLNHGIEFLPLDPRLQSLPLNLLCPEKFVQPAFADASAKQPKLFSSSHYIIAEIRYPDAQSRQNGRAYLVYLKSSLTGDEPRDVLGFAHANPEFPHDSTADQMFEPERFETYRQLGQHVARTTLDRLFGKVPPGAHPSYLLDSIDREALRRRMTSKHNSLEVSDWITEFVDVTRHSHAREAVGGKLLDWLERNPDQFVDVSKIVSVMDCDDKILRKQADEILKRGGIGCLDDIAREGLTADVPQRASAIAQVIAAVVSESINTGDALRVKTIEGSHRRVIERLNALVPASGLAPEHDAALSKAVTAALQALASYCQQIGDTCGARCARSATVRTVDRSRSNNPNGHPPMEAANAS